MKRRCFLPLMLLLLPPAIHGGEAEALAFFETSVRPVLADRCQSCHGAEKQRGGLRLDSREALLKGGDSGPAVSTDDPAASLLLKAISHLDAELKMPPEKHGGKLPDKEAAALTAWIMAGTPWTKLPGTEAVQKPHWSLQPLVRPAIPGETANPIDAFVAAKLKEHSLTASPEADRRTLIRRVYYDLTGLPPSPEEAAAFATDTDPQSFEKLAAKLLDSPRYGERWARHWLDTIHFADSHGYEHDIGRDNAWRFRDYVIAALNKDTAWPRFIREQLAADFFFPDEPHLTPALGFLGAGLFDMSTFGTAVATFDYLDRDDLVTQTMAAFTSTTANCARCHAHKFDPISQEDYYALQAVFAGIIKGEVAYDEDPAVLTARRKWNAVLAACDAQNAELLLSPEHAAAVDEWAAGRTTAAWEPLAAETFISTEGATLSRISEGVILASGPRPEKDTYVFTTGTLPAGVSAVRLNVHPHASLPMQGPGRADNGNLHLSEFEARVFSPDGGQPRALKFVRATADFNQAGWGIERALDGDITTAWGIHPAEGQAHQAVFELAEPLTLKSGEKLVISIRQAHGGSHLIGALSLAVTTAPAGHTAALPPETEAVLAIPPGERTAAGRAVLAAHVLRQKAMTELGKLPPQARVYAAGPSVDVLSGDPPRQAKSLAAPKAVHVLHRGDFDKPRALVGPGALSALTHLPGRFALPDPDKESSRRAALADWLAHPDNVLTWRSIVNRVWHYHFGRGLCDTPSDFGRMGGTPSHPELLDWLAVWFRDDAKGSLKELHRLIVTSATYRQASDHREAPAQQDGDNRLLWRQNRHRLDADAFRDFTTATAGKLDLTMGGPGVQHFKQSKGPQVTPALDYTAYDWNGPGSGRRNIYSYVWRGIADPFMESLDFPDLGLLSPVRGFSASSLQALTLYNNDFVLCRSADLAKRTEGEAAGLDACVARAVSLAWLRPPTAEEQRDYADFARRHGLAALCRLLLNSNEFLFVN